MNNQNVRPRDIRPEGTSNVALLMDMDRTQMKRESGQASVHGV